MNKEEKDKINLFIKDKLLNDFIKHQKFLESKEEIGKELIHIIEIKGELWASIHYEVFFKDLLKLNKRTIKNFAPFFLIPIKLNNYIKLKNEENNNDFYLKLSSLNIKTILNKEIFYIKNSIENNKMEKSEPLIKFDKQRKITYLFTTEDKRSFIKEIKKIKTLDVFNIFEIKKLIYLIEEKLKSYITKEENYFLLSTLDKTNEMIDLKINTIKKEFSKTKPMYFIIREENIILNITED